MGWVAIGAGEVHGHGEVELSTTRDKLQERGPPFHLINRAQYIPSEANKDFCNVTGTYIIMICIHLKA